MLSRSRYCRLGSKNPQPCDANTRLHLRSANQRGEHRGGIGSGPVVAAGLVLVGGEPGAGLPPTFVEGSRVRHGLLTSQRGQHMPPLR